MAENSQDFAVYVPNALLHSYNFTGRIATNAMFLQIYSLGLLLYGCKNEALHNIGTTGT